MDERSQHQHPMPTAQDGRGFGHQQHGRPMPWPGAAPTTPGAPIAGSAPHSVPQHVLAHHEVQAWQSQGGMHQAPHAPHAPEAQPSPQYSYAPGFVLPGAAGGEAPPMAAHGGMIGLPQQQQPGVPMHYGRAPHAVAPWQHGTAAAVVTHEHPQAWAYQTPQGLQLVQPGGATAVHPGGIAHGGGARRRIRWETIVPAAAVVCLVAAVALFISDFDRMTGRDTGSADASQAAARSSEGEGATTPAAADGGDAAAVVAQARTLFEQGRFDDAANLLHPILDVDSPDPAAVALHDRVDAAATRNRALLGRLARERSGGRWNAVLSTIGELQQLRPLSKDLVQLRGTARRQARSQAVVARASSLMAAGKDAEALAVVERGLEAGPNKRLEAMREQLSSLLAAPATRPAGGGRTPPAAGGAAARPNGPAVRPPANVPAGAIPDRPDLPNPTGGGAGVAPTVSGGGAAGGANCHEHDGVRECH